MVNSLGGKTAIWLGNPEDENQGLFTYFSTDPEISDYKENKNIIKFQYDVDSDKPAYCGYISDLMNIDCKLYNQIIIYVKADNIQGCSSKFIIELKVEGKKDKVIVSGVNYNWKKISIPFKSFTNIKKCEKLEELGFVFDDKSMDKKTGILEVGLILLSDGKSNPVKESGSENESKAIENSTSTIENIKDKNNEKIKN